MKFRFSFTLASATFCALLLGCAFSLPASREGIGHKPRVYTNNFNRNGTTINCENGSVYVGSDEDADVRKTVSISAFSKIKVSQGIKVILIPGKFNGKAEIATTESAEPYLKVSVSDNCLRVGYEGSFRTIKGPSIVTVQTDKFPSLSLSSAAGVEVQGDIAVPQLLLDLSSASYVHFKNVTCQKFHLDLSSASSVTAQTVKCDDVEIDVSSAASVNIEMVKGSKLDIESSSASNVSIEGFESSDGKLEAEASSTAQIHVEGIKCRSINAEASSMATVSLQGRCKTISKESSSGGKVKTSGLKSAYTD